MAYVSDHAVLRYLERHCGVDVEAVRKKLTVAAIDKAVDFGCDTVKLGDGSRLKLKGDTACTCFEARKRRRGLGRER